MDSESGRVASRQYGGDLAARETTEFEEPLTAGTFLLIWAAGAELAGQGLLRTLDPGFFVCSQRVANDGLLDAAGFQLVRDANRALSTRDPGPHEDLDEAVLVEQAQVLEFVQHGINAGVVVPTQGELAFKLAAGMLAPRQRSQRHATHANGGVVLAQNSASASSSAGTADAPVCGKTAARMAPSISAATAGRSLKYMRTLSLP